MGRPTKLDDIKAQRVVQAIASGQSRACAAGLVGVNVRTLHAWMETNPQFHQRVKEADAKAEQKVVDALYCLATDSERPHFEALKFWLKTRRANTWRELQASAPKELESDLSAKDEAELIAAVDQWMKARKTG